MGWVTLTMPDRLISKLKRNGVLVIAFKVLAGSRKFYTNCAFFGKSIIIFPMIFYDIVINIIYGIHRYISHNFGYRHVVFYLQNSSMEIRLGQKNNNNG